MNDVNPRVDLAFKKIFGIEENKDLLISLINSIVDKADQVTNIKLLNPYNERSFKKDKLSVLDIKAEGHDGKKFNIEIQVSDEADYDKRALYYWAKLYTSQLESGTDYSTLDKVIGIHILNFTSIPEMEDYHNVFHIKDRKKGRICFRDFELHTIELNKFTDGLGDGIEGLVSKIKNMLDIWSAFLTKHDLLDSDNLAENFNIPELKKAIGVLKIMNFSPEEREEYEDRLKWLRIEANSLKKAEARGRKEGLEEGIKEGRKEGLEEGRKEVALVLLKQGLQVNQISEATGLSDEEVLSLRK